MGGLPAAPPPPLVRKRPHGPVHPHSPLAAEMSVIKTQRGRALPEATELSLPAPSLYQVAALLSHVTLQPQVPRVPG